MSLFSDQPHLSHLFVGTFSWRIIYWPLHYCYFLQLKFCTLCTFGMVHYKPHFHLFMHSFIWRMWSYAAFFTALLIHLMVPIFFTERSFWNNITNHKVMAALAVCWVHFSLPKYAARGGPIWDGFSFKINILYDLKNPSVVFLLAILV